MTTSQSLPTPGLSSVPCHVAVIMDGNGRWAERHGLPRIAGHRRGVQSVRDLVRACADKRISYLTLFAFSSENWRRPVAEVRLLMELLTNALENEVKKLHEHHVRLRVVGDLGRFSPRVRMLIRHGEDLTSQNSLLNLTIAANYGGRWDIAQACQQIAKRIRDGDIDPDLVDAQVVEAHLATHFLPEPDLFIRTGGEQRISNFLLWQLAYTELYFADVLWPDFDAAAFDDAIASFARRQRRFGQTGEQVAAGREARNA